MGNLTGLILYFLLIGSPAPAAALSEQDKAWMMKVDYRNIKTATDRCKTIRRSCLAFAEEPIPASDWAWILKGLSPEERELMRRRYSIGTEAMAAANGQAVRAARPRGDDYRDAVGSTPAGFRETASRRIGRLTGSPAAVQAPETASDKWVPRQVPAAAAAVLTKGVSVRRPATPPPAPVTKPDAKPAKPAETDGIPPGRLARINSAFLQAATSGRFTAASVEPGLRWGKENPPASAAERNLRDRLKSLRPLLGSPVSEEGAEKIKAVAKEAGLTLTPAQEANLIQAFKRGFSFGDKLRLMGYQ